MRSTVELPCFRPLVADDIAMLHEWLRRPHVAEWWGEPGTYADVESDYLPYAATNSTTRGYIALLDEERLGGTIGSRRLRSDVAGFRARGASCLLRLMDAK